MVTATNGSEKVMRYVSHFKRPPAVPVARYEEDRSADNCPESDSEGVGSETAAPHLPEPYVRDRAVSGRPARMLQPPVAANEMLLHTESLRAEEDTPMTGLRRAGTEGTTCGPTQSHPNSMPILYRNDACSF
ncbi:hypothetical protein NDU88_005897 [Pleurodeles waltl]|uniref:Uncharacterized protein n=1 Tax=Pleurodeles waltl TaxID=8319 RepID=A0AAV7VPQ4_PLEWA|nr:hypothetical protein NDU88_005897 [Pleurodeles waltl]